jgi:hypothetical protein
MEPIERELLDRNERLKKMVLELQRLEAIRPMRPPPSDVGSFLNWDEHDRKMVQLSYKIGQAQSGIQELKEIIAEGRRPPPARKPDTSRRRKLTDAERASIAAEERARFLEGKTLDEDWELHIHVERFTDLEGNPQIRFVSRMKPHRLPRPSRDS